MIGANQYGLGATGNQLVSVIGGTTGSTIGVLTPIILGAAAGPVGVAVGAIVASVSALAGALGVGEGCGPTCVQATNIVNQAEPVLQQNLVAYENGQIDQATAVANYQTIWSNIQKACAAIPGSAGQNCVSDRQAGSCKWKQTGQPQYSGQPQLGECWNWDNAYYQPLLLAPVNVPVSSSVVVGSQLTSSSMLPLLLAGGIVLFGMSLAK